MGPLTLTRKPADKERGAQALLRGEIWLHLEWDGMRRMGSLMSTNKTALIEFGKKHNMKHLHMESDIEVGTVKATVAKYRVWGEKLQDIMEEAGYGRTALSELE